MADYLTGVFARALNQLLLLLGGIFVLAFLLCQVSTQIRATGERVMGRGYYYVVAPGVVCHETGHALGCLLTGRKIQQFAPFRPQGDTLGYVQYAYSPNEGSFVRMAHFVIGTGPIWFGCLVICILVRLFARVPFLPRYRTAFPLLVDSLDSGKYWLKIGESAFTMFVRTARIWKLRSTLDVLFLYLIFCIASEMTLSWSDIWGAWYGFVMVAAFFLAVNIVPAVGRWWGRLLMRARPFVFAIQTVMLFVLLGDVFFFVVIILPLRLALT